MEEVGSWERKTVISELTQGRELANELKNQLFPTITSREACGLLLEKILSSYDNALALLNCMALLENIDTPSQIAIANLLEQPGSPRSEGSDPDSKDHAHKHVSKKRKTMPKWSEQVRVSSGSGSEGQLDDGYNWRKYGQKDILGANHPRAYYRCTHRNTQGCLATKQVQRADDDPSIIEVIYRGKHSCAQERAKHNKENLSLEKKQEKKNQTGILPIKGLKPETQELNVKPETFPSFSFPSTPIEPDNFGTQFFPEPNTPFLSPETSESYFSLSQQCPVTEFAEIISNPTPNTNSLFGDLLDFDSHFFDGSDYLL